MLQVNSGEAVPTDGVIIKGIASINEAMISGETLPKAKDIGEKVIGGTILVEGNMQMKVTELGKDTTLANIIAQVKAAQQLKPNIQKNSRRYH
ncbi:MAG: cation-translocating P-type ATPase [Chitinophagales bacterium]|nr:cation-translocating P-type ATPase [Chitinophagales bacterium]